MEPPAVDGCSPIPGAARTTGGFALPIVLVALVLVGAMTVAALVTASDERRAARAMRRSVDAFYAAEAGINEVRATWNDSLVRALGPRDSVDLGWRALEGGARYHAVIQRYDNGGQRTYGIAVEGRDAGTAGGQRLLRYLMTDPRVPLHHEFRSALSTTSGLSKSGGSGSISGHDLATGSDCPEGGRPSIPGAITPDSALWQDGAVVTDSVTWLEGSTDFEWYGTSQEVGDHVRIDWQGILDLPPDYDVQQPSDFPPVTAYGTSWPIIRVADGIQLTGTEVPDPGHGLIVAPGDLHLGDGFEWDGLVLLGDSLRLIDDVRIRGGVVAGLDVTLGGAVGDSEVGPGPTAVRYHSCNIIEAGRAAMDRGYAGAGPAPIKPFNTRPFTEVLR